MHVRSFETIAALRAAGGATGVRIEAGSLFQTLDWFELLIRHALPADAVVQLPAVAVAAADAPIGLCLPLMRCGQELSSLANYYSGIYGPVLLDDAAAAARPQALAALCRHLRASRPRAAVIRLQPLDTEDAFMDDMRTALVTAGYRVDGYFCFGNWYLPCAGLRYADYLAGRASVLRNTLRRGRGRLDRAGNWQLRIHHGPGPGLDGAIADFETIYRCSWKPAESHPDFIRELCQLAARRGWLRLGVLSLAGKAIASQIWLFDNGTSFIFKLAYDPDTARYSPGTVLTAAMMEHALERDMAREIDYLSGDDAYKKDWMSRRRERHGLVAFDLATLRGLVAALRHQGGRALSWLRRAHRRIAP